MHMETKPKTKVPEPKRKKVDCKNLSRERVRRKREHKN